MPTFAQIRTKVSRKLIDPSNTAVSVADVGDAINDALNFWKQRPLWFNQKTATTTLVIGDPVIPGMPSDFLFEDSENGFVIPYQNITYTLEKKPPKIYDAVSIAGALGLPSIYTWRNGVYSVYYNPNLAYTLNIYYTADYTALSADSDNNDFTNYADQLLMYETLSRLSGEDRQDLQMDNSYAAKADREYNNLTMRSFRQKATGYLTINTILH